MSNVGRYSFFAIPLLMLLTTPVFAQSSPPGPPPTDSRVNTDRIRQQQMSSREWQLRNFGYEKDAPKDKRQLDALMAQTEEDFTRILTLHNEFARLLAASRPIEYSFISEASAEIKKRASRLQSTLALHQLANETPVVNLSQSMLKMRMAERSRIFCARRRGG